MTNQNEISRGSIVYVNRAAFGSDGIYGICTVVRLSADGRDLYLAKGGEYSETPDEGDWDIIVNRARCVLTD